MRPRCAGCFEMLVRVGQLWACLLGVGLLGSCADPEVPASRWATPSKRPGVTPTARPPAVAPFHPRLAVPWTPRGAPSPGEGVQVSVGPCSYYDGTVEAVQVVAWRFAPVKGSHPALPRWVRYGETPKGYRDRHPPAPLSDGCYCTRLIGMSGIRRDFEVRGRRILSPCRTWSRPDLVLPPGWINAYVFGKGSRREQEWYVRPDGHIRVTTAAWKVWAGEDKAKRHTIGHLIARWLPPRDPPRALLSAVAGKPTGPKNSVRPARLLLGLGAGRLHEHMVRWIGDHGVTLDAALVVRRDGSGPVTLLDPVLISQSGIADVIAHGVGDLDGDGLPDLVVVFRPCCDSRPVGVMGDLYLTRAAAGRIRFTLETNAAFAKLIRRLGLRSRFYVHPKGRDPWAVSMKRDEVTLRLRGTRRRSRLWRIRRTGDKVSITRTDATGK